MGKHSILKHSSILIIFTFLSRILGLLREMTKAYFLGTSALSDAFSIAFLLPNLLRRLFGEGSIAAAFVPTIKGYLHDNKKEEVKKFITSFFTFASFVFSITVIIAIIYSDTLVNLLYEKKLDNKTITETIFLTRLMFPYLAFVSIAALFQGILNGLNIFGPSGFMPIISNICIISSAFLFKDSFGNPARAMAIGVLIGGFTQAVFQLPFIIKKGYGFGVTTIGKSIKHPGTKKVLKLITPTIIGMGAYQINILISSVIAASAGEGIVSALSFSNRLLELVLGIFAVSLGTVILSELSSNAKKKEWQVFNQNAVFALKLIAFLTIPATLFTLINSSPIVTLLFKINVFNEKSVAITSSILVFHIIGLFFIASNRVVSPVFYATEDTTSPTIAGIISVVANIILALFLVGKMGGKGIALAATLSAVIYSLTLYSFLFLKKDIDALLILRTFGYSLKILLVSLLPAIIVYQFSPTIFTFFKEYSWKIIYIGAPLTISALTFYLIFILILIITKDSQIVFILESLKKISRKKR